MNESINDNVKVLIARSLTGELSPIQQRELHDWLERSPENRKAFESFKTALSLTEQQLGLTQGDSLPVDVEVEWKVFLNSIHIQKAPVRPLHVSTSFSWMKIAASLLLVALSAYLVFYFATRNSLEEFHTAGATREVKLPDGSTVVLNRFSSLQYDQNFGNKTRTVSFNGEGFFEVIPDREKPFVIHLKNASVEVVGTSFNVLAYDTSDIAEVIVKTGIVKLVENKTTHYISLKAGELGSYASTEQKLATQLNNDVNYLSWQTREIIFEETSLSQVIETLNKTYGAHLVLSNAVSDACVVTVSFSHQSLDSVLKVLENTLNLKYTIKDNVIEITASGC